MRSEAEAAKRLKRRRKRRREKAAKQQAAKEGGSGAAAAAAQEEQVRDGRSARWALTFNDLRRGKGGRAARACTRQLPSCS